MKRMVCVVSVLMAVCVVVAGGDSGVLADDEYYWQYSAASCFEPLTPTYRDCSSSQGFHNDSSATVAAFFCPVNFLRHLDWNGDSRWWYSYNADTSVSVTVNDQSDEDAVSCRVYGSDTAIDGNVFDYSWTGFQGTDIGDTGIETVAIDVDASLPSDNDMVLYLYCGIPKRDGANESSIIGYDLHMQKL